MARDSALYRHARREFERVGLLARGEPLPNSLVGISLMLTDLFDNYRSRSRNTVGVIDLINDILIRLPLRSINKDLDVIAVENMCRLMAVLPLTPLTGADEEWVRQSSGIEVNRRCPRVQRSVDKAAYDTRAPQSDGSFANKPVTFPYYPRRKPERA